MTEIQPTAWAQARFGARAAEMTRAVTLAIQSAHNRALAAHLAGDLTTNDAYGATLHVAQYEELIAFARDIPGVAIRRPVDVASRFELVVVDAPPVVLYPWRYATEQGKARDAAKLRPPVSDLRKALLTLAGRELDPQLTLEQGAQDSDVLEAELAEEAAVLEQLAQFGEVVTVAFGSNPVTGLFDLGWGDMELVNDETGTVNWHHWEPLSRGEQTGGTGTVTAPITPVTPIGGPDRAGRFDDAPLNDDFGLTPRSPLAVPPTSEPDPQRPETGTEEPQ